MSSVVLMNRWGGINMKKYSVLILFASFLLLSTMCDGIMEFPIENKLIYGTWNWIISIGWPGDKTPEIAGYTRQINFSYPNSYEEKRDGIIVTSSQFTIAEEDISTTFVRANVLTIDNLFKYTFDFVSIDTLKLYPLYCSDCYDHIVYVRIE